MKLDTDIKPVSERGHSAAAPLNVAEHEVLIDEFELLRDVGMAVQQLEAGKGISHREARAELRRRFGR
jgi:hypothetical protein